ncbi:Uncharacterised protein [Shigella sonnei]|nr:Uncharacterised protein [Shigella sonnei]
MPKMAIAHALIVKRNVTKTVFVPHFHTVITTGPTRENVLPDAKTGE